MEFCVIIPSANPNPLHYCLIALKRQIYQPDKILISISTDDPVKVAEIEREAQMADVSVVYPEKKNNRSAARNEGVRHCDKDVMMFLDEDVILNPMHFNNLFEQINLCFCWDYMIHCWRKSLEPHWGFEMHKREYPDKAFCGWLDSMKDPFREGWQLQDTSWDHVVSNNVVMKKVSFLNNNLWFDENFVGWGEEDVDWAWRARTNFKILIMNSLTWHITHNFDATERLRTFRINARYLARKHPDILRIRGPFWQEVGLFDSDPELLKACQDAKDAKEKEKSTAPQI